MARPEPSPLKFLLAKTASGTQTLILGVVWGLALTGKLASAVEHWALGKDGTDEPITWDALDQVVTSTSSDTPSNCEESPAE